MLKQEDFRALGKIQTWKTVRDISMCWIIIAASASLIHLSWWFLPVAVLLIASRLHAMTLIMHDGAHHLLHKNPIINDVLSNFFCSFPLMISTEAYRKTHYRHHQYTQTMQDPNFVIMQREEPWHFPKPKDEIKRMFIKDLFLLSLKEHLVIFRDWQVVPNFGHITKLEKVLFPIFLMTCGTLIISQGLWREFLVIQLGALYVNPFARLRAMSEHIHQESKGQSKIHKLEETPTINANWIEKIFIAPFNTNRHLEHHLYPTIPYYNLEKIHEIICHSELYKKHCLYELDGYVFGKRTSLDEVLSPSLAKSHSDEKVA